MMKPFKIESSKNKMNKCQKINLFFKEIYDKIIYSYKVKMKC